MTEYLESAAPGYAHVPGGAPRAIATRRDRAAPRRRRRRRIARIAALVVALLLLPVAWSYTQAITAPGTDSVTARSTEWLRGHGFNGVVNRVEDWWYSHHPPKVGGTPKGGIPTVPKVAARAAHANVAVRARPQPPGLPPPAPVASPAAPPLPGEGVWKPTGMPVQGRPAMYVTYVRPDAIHTSLLTGLVRFDPKLLRAVLVPGLEQPTGAPHEWGAQVPLGLRATLVGAFNSGFRIQDAQGGYFAGGQTYAPLLAGRAAAVITTDGMMRIGEWGRDFTGTAGLQSVRQNLWLIVDHGQVVPGLPTNHSAKWGATIGARVYVYRSGVGVTRDGAIVYAGGDGLTVASLADLLHRAGAVEAMELDINPEWVSCYTYQRPDPRNPRSVVGDRLAGASDRPGDRYLVAGTRDFFAFFART